MFGPFGIPVVPVDKESLQFMCAWNLLKSAEDEAIEALDEWRRKEDGALVATRKENESEKALKSRREKQEAVQRTYNENLKAIKKTRRQREIDLFRHTAGPLAQIAEGNAGSA